MEQISNQAQQKNQNSLKDLDIQIDHIKLNGKLNAQDVSYKIIERYKDLEQLEDLKPISSIMSVKNSTISDEYSYLQQITSSKEHTQKLINDQKLIELNRYIDILPYEDTAVKLNISENKGHEYINANYISSPFGSDDKRIIATQGPIDSTEQDFWVMVIQQKVKLIITLCNLVEAGRQKCIQYWPKTQQTNKDFTGFQVSLIKEEFISHHLIKRTFLVKTKEEKLEIEQLHYMGWPDHGIPDNEAFKDFELVLENFIQFICNRELPDQKAIVHCSAGIGRTGTIIALQELIINVLAQQKKDKSLYSVFSTVRRIREQRFGMVQVFEQYFFIYQFFRHWLKKEKFISQ